MDHSRLSCFSLLGTVVLLHVLMFAGCGGGGGTVPQPQPQQQQQQQQQPPSGTQAAVPDTTAVTATVTFASNAFHLGAGAGSVLPNATVFIEDSQSFVSDSKTAGADGSFEFTEADIPPNFLRAPGSAIRIYQFTSGTLRSEPATVSLQGI